MESMSSFTVFIVFLCIISVFCDTEEGQHVVSFTESTFDEEVVNMPHFVMFYAPWCGHCKKLTPTWNELAKFYNTDNPESGIVIAKVDCTEYTALCSQYEVTGYPTLKLFNSLATEFSTRYRGDRTLHDLKIFVTEHLHNKPDPVDPSDSDIGHILSLTEKISEEIAEDFWFIKFFVPWCPHCKTLAPTWKKLSNEISNSKIHIAQIDCTQYEFICRKEGIEGYPTIAVFHNGEKIKKAYTGLRDLASLKKLVTQTTNLPLTEIIGGAEGQDLIEDRQDNVEVLDENNFESSIAEGFYFVEFYAPWCGHCQHLAPVWMELAEKLLTIEDLTIAKVNCDDNKLLCEEREVDSYPTLYLYKNGEFIAEYSDNRDLENLERFVRDQLQESSLEKPEEELPDNLIVLTNKEYHSRLNDGIWFVLYHIPSCRYCKRIMPMWKRISREVKDTENLYMAIVNCKEEFEVCHQSQISAYPTIKTYRDSTFAFDMYGGPKEYEDLSKYVIGLHETLERTNPRKKVKKSTEPHFVETLTDDNMKTSIADGYWFIKYYVSWCSHCKNLEPIWEDVSREMNGKKGLHMAQINCEASPDVCKTQEITSYPTLIFYRDGFKFDTYGGYMEKDDLTRWVGGLHKIISEVSDRERKERLEEIHLDASNFGEVTAEGWHFVLFYGTECETCEKVISLWTRLTLRSPKQTFNLFALIDCDVSIDICTEFEISSYPTTILFHQGKKVDTYTGPLMWDDVYDFYVAKH